MGGTVKFRIKKSGEVIADAEGFNGPICLEKTSRLTEGLGIKTGEETKPEFYEEAGVEIFNQ